MKDEFLSLKNKKGAVTTTGTINLASKFFIAVLIIGIIGFALIVVLGNLETSGNTALPTKTGPTINNESITSVTETGEALSVYDRTSVACTISAVYNATGNSTTSAILLTSGNYTTAGAGNCLVKSVGTDAVYNNSNWNVTYGYTYKDPYAQDSLRNLTSGTSTFFSGANTWMTLLSVVIIIAIVVVVIFVIRRTGKANRDY